MRLKAAALLFALLVSSLPPAHGVLEAYNTDLKCRCIQWTSRPIYPVHVERLQIIPPGNGCPNKEIILWMKDKSIICVKSVNQWIKKIIRRFQIKRFSTPPVPVIKRRIA